MGGGARRLCITTDDGGSDEYQTLAGEVVHNFVRGGSGGGDLLVNFGESQSRKYLLVTEDISQVKSDRKWTRDLFPPHPPASMLWDRAQSGHQGGCV